MREVSSTGVRNPLSTPPDTEWQDTENVQAHVGEIRLGLVILWIFAILLFGVGDLLTSSLAFSLGAYEGNPVANYLIEITGGSIWSLTILKSFILSSLFLISYIKMDGYAWTVPAMLSCAGAYMLFHNLAVVIVLL